MTNPDNIVRIRSRNGGRASVYEANMWAQGFTSGLFSGNGVLPNTSPDMNVRVGGSSSNPDVVLAQNAAGYKIALDIVGQQLIAVTAPASNSRISAIVAYSNDLSTSSTDASVTGSPSSCGLIVVNGTAGASPSPPTGAQIRAAITADGGTGTQAVYAIIANIRIASSTTTITPALISGEKSIISSDKYQPALSDVGTSSNKDSNSVVASIPKFNFIQGRKYLLVGSALLAVPLGGGAIWEMQTRVGGVSQKGYRVSSRNGESGLQTGFTIMKTYTATATGELSVDLFAARLLNDNLLNLEAPSIEVIPQAAS